MIRVFIEDSKYPDRVTHPTGYGEVHRQLIFALDRLGVDVYFPPCRPEILATRVLCEETRAHLLRFSGRCCPHDRQTVYLQIASPESFRARPKRFNVGLTMTERESLAYYNERFDWVGLCNEMDLILTPSEWNRQVFGRHGIRNVVVTPLGVDCEFFSPRCVSFLSLMAGFGREGSRANWQDIVDCFREEFRGQRDVVLTIVSHDSRRRFEYGNLGEVSRMLWPDATAYITETYRGPHPQVVVREQQWDLTREEVRQIYREHDCYVSYSREGWGLPTLEAMACGLDVIACDYGAPMTYLAESPAMLFAAGRLRPDNLKFEGGDMARLRRHMRSVYEKRHRTREWIKRFGWTTAAERMRNVLAERHREWLSESA